MKKEHIYIGIAIIIIGSGLLLLNKNRIEETDENTNPSTNVPNNTGGTSKNNPIGVPTQPAVPTIPTAASLVGSTLRLASYNGVALPISTKYSLSFGDGTLNAKFCNSMSGSFVLDEGLLRANNLASTLMYCSTPSNLMEIETAFASMLDTGATIYRSGGTIIISSASKGTVMVFSGF